MAYNQYQLALLQYYAANPQALGWLRQSFQTAQAPDQAAIDAQARAKQNEYLSGQVAPQLARLMVSDGPTASSFAAARQAALAQAGQAQAENVYADAKANAQDAAYRQYAMQKQYDDDNWNGFSGGLYANGGPGAGQDQGMRVGGVGSPTTRTPGMNGQFTDKALEYGAGALNYVGKKAYTDMSQGTNPFTRYGNALGQVGGAIYGAPKAIGSAIRNGWNSM